MDNLLEKAVHAQYERLGAKGKPQKGEWTVLAGFVLRGPAGLDVVALGTGTKCLSASSIASDTDGGCIHDAHAEVCARRSLRLFLVDQVRCHAEGRAEASVLQLSQLPGRSFPSFELRPGSAWI